ncbi:MAG: hypothetical protein WC695_02990 [Candidatus Omnitrophota bacterium]
MIIKKSLAGAVVLIGVCMLFSFPAPGVAAPELVSLYSGLRFVGEVSSRDDQYLILEKDKVKYQIALSEIVSTEPFSGTADEVAAAETGQEWSQIAEVMYNYFLHRYDEDPQAALSSVSRSFFNETMTPGESVDYQGLERFLKKRSLKMQGQLEGSLVISSVLIESNLLSVTISFKEDFLNLKTHTRSIEQREKIVVLSQEGRGWKIVNILAPSARQ